MFPKECLCICTAGLLFILTKLGDGPVPTHKGMMEWVYTNYRDGKAANSYVRTHSEKSADDSLRLRHSPNQSNGVKDRF